MKKILFKKISVGIFAILSITHAIDIAAQTNIEKIQKAKDPHAGLERMNGYSLKDYPDFARDWAFVTVRYRKDTGEMRITYANDSAWKTLSEGKTDYPDGAIFAKIGLMTEEDKGFVSSMVPSGAQRYQLMVMDKAKHKDTDGWGYALFDQSGLTFGEDPKQQEQACHACHKLVPERGYVFSQPVQLQMGIDKNFKLNFGDGKPPAHEGLYDKLKFETVKAAELPEKLQKKLPADVKEVRQLRGDLEKNLFYGTLDEIRPSLARESIKAGMPAALVGQDGRLFSVAFKNPGKNECTLENGEKGIPIKAYFTDVSREGNLEQKLFVRDIVYCKSVK